MVKYSGPAYQHKEETKQDDKQNGLINKTDKTHLTRQRNEKVPFFHHNQDKEKTDSMKRTRKRITQTNKDGKTTPFLKKERSST
ncbi:MAG: hypothetical protein L0K82_04605, partial [Pisciglobus halotolerans]|nr:hypothetical protein [Pisciglobus halotolerans]